MEVKNENYQESYLGAIWPEGETTSSGYWQPGISNNEATGEISRSVRTIDDRPFQFKLAYLQATFSLNPTDLHKMAKVDRKTIYNWLDADDEPSVTKTNLLRIDTLYSIAKYWRNRFRWKLTKELKKSSGLIEILSAKNIEDDLPKVEEFLDTLSDLAIEHEAKHQDVRELGVRHIAQGTPRAKKPLGIDPFRG